MKSKKGETGKSTDPQLEIPTVPHAPHAAAIPDKMFYKISDVATIAGIETHVLRYWETEFGELKPRKSQSGRRQYSRQDIEHVLEIKSLLYDEGFSIAGAKKRLQKRKRTTDDKDAIIEAVRQTKKGLEDILTILGS